MWQTRVIYKVAVNVATYVANVSFSLPAHMNCHGQKSVDAVNVVNITLGSKAASHMAIGHVCHCRLAWTDPKSLIPQITVFNICSLKVLSSRKWGGSKLVSIEPQWKSVLPASVVYHAPRDTITRGALTFLAAVVLFDAIPAGWVSNISQRPNIFVDFLLKRRLVLKNHKSLRWREDQCRNEESFYSLCKEVEGSLC